ncbi:unnamed protein product [Peronospora belbahrii]|uniref:Uncharacterized protein n=1 Tax=Peronospora belbahrii TaxID=622444 RepID=A0AAU9KX08_9STRA|nr:unnamed protein product [Peronospora belbahrii]CAH0517799.1 unnamed protein product [Peronospora belbahrii]
MRPSQYPVGDQDSVNKKRIALDKQDKSEKETLRQSAIRRDPEHVSMEQVLLNRRWFFHSTSPLFHFHCDELSAYAHDLVKTLRAAALRACGQQFGYSVSIRNTNRFVAFQIREEYNQRRGKTTKMGVATPEREVSERSGGFVLYFPMEEEQRVSHKARERQQVLLLRGNEELLRWVCSWLQRRFQCVVTTHVVRIQQMNLKRLARNWVVASLSAEEARLSSDQRDMNSQEKELAGSKSIATRKQPRAPLRLKYRAAKDEDVVRTYTLTVPWATLHRLFRQTKNGPGGGNRSSTHVPELIELTERLYADALPFDLSAYKIERIEMQEVVVDLDGGVEFYSMDHVHTVLFGLQELLVLQNVVTASRQETTL